MAHRDAFSQFKIVEEHEIGPITVFKMIDVIKTPNEFLYGIVTTLETARNDLELAFEAQNMRRPDGSVIDLSCLNEDEMHALPYDPKATLCTFYMRDTEEEVDRVIDLAREDFSRYAV